MVAYQLTWGKRKSLSIMVGRDGAVHVKAPNGLPKYKIDQLVQRKAGWIEKKRAEVCLLEQKIPAHSFQEGDHFLIFGEAYRLVFCNRQSKGPAEVRVDQENKLLVIGTADTTPPHIQKELEGWYIRQAKQVFPARVSLYYSQVAQMAGRMGKEIGSVNRISIRNQKTRWGSCSSKGNLNFNWRLLMAPNEVLDYVVVHELCHFAYLDHSKLFWQMVEGVLPGFQEQKEWLKANGALLDWEGGAG